MHYLHTMVRVKNLDEALEFWCGKFGLVEFSRRDDEKGKYTNVFLRAPGDPVTTEHKAPLLEITHNWTPEDYTGGRNFGHLAYAVDNIYEYCAQLQKKGTLQRSQKIARSRSKLSLNPDDVVDLTSFKNAAAAQAKTGKPVFGNSLT